MKTTTKRFLAGAAALTVGLSLSACGSAESLDGAPASGEPTGTDTTDTTDNAADHGVITIGSFNHTEAVVLANIYADALEQAGYETQVKANLGSREVTFPALQDGSLDMMIEYAGSLLIYLDADSGKYETGEIIEALHTTVPDEFVILEPADAQNRDVTVVTGDYAEEHGLVTIADLEPLQDEITFGGPPESVERRAGLQGIKELYGIEFGDFMPIDKGGPITVSALNGGDVQVAQMFSTQPAITQNGYVVLEDPMNLSSAENIVPLVRASIVTPELEDVINRVTESLTTEKLMHMNSLVEVDKQDPQKVAKEYVESLDL